MIKYSRQRAAIIDFLSTRKDHPTAETVHASVREAFPNISLGTVYRNLSLLAELGEIQKLSVSDGPDRFDYIAAPHCHFYCRACDSMIDIDLCIDDLEVRANEAFAGRIERSSVQFTGLCPDCKKTI